MEYREFKVNGDGKFGYVFITHNGSGKIPKALSGMFTSYPEAQKAINKYLSDNKRIKKNATTASSTGDK